MKTKASRGRTRNSLAPISINGTRIKPKDAVHRRKLLALQAYVKNLLASPARPDIAKIILFGSVAKGEARRDSDVDVLVIGFDNLESLRSASYDATLELGGFAGEGIEPLFETIDELVAPEDYFRYEVTRFGKEIYSVSDEQIKRAEAHAWLNLARDYVSYAEHSLTAGDLRAVADLAYNGAELCAKALLLFKMDKMPGSHGGLLEKFGELLVKSGPFPRELGHRLNRGLQVRSGARYKPKETITREMAEENLTLAREMIVHLEKYLQEAEQ